jgi:phosphatidylserine/phosphatidylglycerophosphate/cardiolipin synthase-like enzyme
MVKLALIIIGALAAYLVNMGALRLGIYPGYASGAGLLITGVTALFVSVRWERTAPKGERNAVIPALCVTVGACLYLAVLAVSSKADAQPLNIGNVPCEVRFSPNGGITAGVVDLIDAAQHDVRVLAYNFTSQPIAQALVAAHQRGVDVQVVLDRSVPAERNTALPLLLAAHIPARIDKRHRIAHNKVIIVDGLFVETGSFNYTDSAERANGENALFCDSEDMAAAYLGDWQTHAHHSEVILAMPVKGAKL